MPNDLPRDNLKIDVYMPNYFLLYIFHAHLSQDHHIPRIASEDKKDGKISNGIETSADCD